MNQLANTNLSVLPAAAVEVTVAICTLRRPQIEEALCSLGGQIVPDQTKMRVLVIDNDDHDRRRPEIIAMGRANGLDLDYIHAPRFNISTARNAGLDACRTRWLAFMDDDEVALDDWVATLLAHRHNHHAVFGIARAIYPETGAPSWIAGEDFHSNVMAPQDPPWKGYTCNVLIDMNFVRQHGLRFREELGQIGGEDTIFFREMYKSGAQLAYAPGAIVEEPTPLSRMTLGWLIKRRFRSGQVHFLVLRQDGQMWKGSAMAMAKAGAFLLLAALNVPRPPKAAKHVLRAALHVGVFASALGFAPYREYSAPA